MPCSSQLLPLNSFNESPHQLAQAEKQFKYCESAHYSPVNLFMNTNRDMLSEQSSLLKNSSLGKMSSEIETTSLASSSKKVSNKNNRYQPFTRPKTDKNKGESNIKSNIKDPDRMNS